MLGGLCIFGWVSTRVGGREGDVRDEDIAFGRGSPMSLDTQCFTDDGKQSRDLVNPAPRSFRLRHWCPSCIRSNPPPVWLPFLTLASPSSAGRAAVEFNRIKMCPQLH